MAAAPPPPSAAAAAGLRAAAAPAAIAANADADAADDDNAPFSSSAALTFTCQLCRARISLTGELEGSLQLLHPAPPGAAGAASHQRARMDESFVVLPTMTRALLPPPSSSSPPPLAPSTSSSSTVDAKLRALTALFEAASTSSGADHPLCLDCSARLRDELLLQEREAKEEARGYEAALARLGRRQQRGQQQPREETQEQEDDEEQHRAQPPPPPQPPTPPAAFEAELAALRDRERAAHRRAEDLSSRLATLRAELAHLEATDAADLELHAQAYWRDAAATQAALDHHVSERDALLARTERASQRLAVLRGTSALNDACRIWHEGPFGTIGGFRLGRTPEQPVPWDEINAAWGLAVLLLSAMSRSARVTFSGARRLLPLGSRARVADARGTHDLFGPVSRLWTAPYDRAMAAYVGCLAEFGEFARARDLAEGRDPPFEFPFAVDGSAATVGGHSVRLALNKEARWTRALKLMLADLKVALQWAARREATAGAAARARGAALAGGGAAAAGAAAAGGQQQPGQAASLVAPLAPEPGG
jgi:beclin 1